MKFMLPASAKNWLTVTGVVIALTALLIIVFLFIVSVLVGVNGAYLGLLTYILLPAVMVGGLLLIPAGMLLKLRRSKRAGHVLTDGWPRIDLNQPHYRNAFFIFTVGTVFFLMLSAVGSYEAFHYTESVSFCGTLCHRVMEPEHVAHKNSPHAKVPCVACHVGPGADWYLRSKLSGLYQIYAVLADVYPRPIPTPIKNLRPARAVCEQCHWPEKFYGYRLQTHTHYLADRDNTPWRIALVFKTGPVQEPLGYVEGIHWHINPAVRIEYVATDPGREQIPWVRVTDAAKGTVKIFQDKDKPMAPGQLEKSGTRTMDCMDCHNRPSHLYRPPSRFLDAALTAGRIPASLPEIKKVAVQLCIAPYPSKEEAAGKIKAGIEQFYQSSYPAVYSGQRGAIEKAIAGIQQEYSRNIFPYMKARWSVYPDHIGHLYANGCFRCHSGNHRSDKGETISKDCALCHNIVHQGTPGKQPESAPQGQSLAFKHPVDIGNAWQETPCVECHKGGSP